MDKDLRQTEDFLLDESFKSWVLHPTPELDAYWTTWLEAHPKQREAFLWAKEIILLASVNNTSLPATQNVTAKGYYATSRVPEKSPGTGISNIPQSIPWLLASMTLLLVTWLSFYLYPTSTFPTSDPATLQQLTVKANPKGRKSKIRLPDGSFVYLNAESRMEYPALFSDSLRVVKLMGEAYFEIAKDRKRPFVVHTDDLKITALGTAFNVRAFQEDEQVSVSLTEGRVRVSADVPSRAPGPNNNYYLSPDQAVIFSKKNRQIALGTFDPKPWLGKMEPFTSMMPIWRRSSPD